MRNRTAVGLTVLALAVAILSAAVKLGNFTNVAIAWGLVASAILLTLLAAGFWIWPYLRRIVVRWPIRILPAHFASEHIYTVDKLEAEFIRFRDAFEDADGSFHMLREVYDFNEKVVRKGMRNITGMGPHSYGVERTVADQYIVAKQNLWKALNEFTEIYRRLT